MQPNDKNEPLFETVTRFFDEDEWPYDQMEGRTVLRTGFRGDNGSWKCLAQVQEGPRFFIFYSVLDAYVLEKHRQAMAEFLTRANYGLIIGNFEMDISDGEVRYKTSIDVEGDRLSIPLIRQMVYANVLTMNRYLPGIMQVAYGATTPEEAISAIET